MSYNYVATSVAGFVQQLAVSYIRHGYWFYVAGHVPPGRLPEDIDAKLIAQYDVAKSRWQRARRKAAGNGNVHYLRFASFWVLIANNGKHLFFDRESGVTRHVRREPIAFAGYSIGYRRSIHGEYHPSVRIHVNEYRWLKSYMCKLARNSTAEEVADEFKRLRFEPYAPVVRQLFSVLRAVNRTRKLAGLKPGDGSAIRVCRRVVKPFEPRTENLPAWPESVVSHPKTRRA